MGTLREEEKWRVWRKKEPEYQDNQKENPTQLSPPLPSPPPPPMPSITPEKPLPGQTPKDNPDHNSQKYENIAKGLPPVQLGSSEDQLHEGDLGEVTFRGGVVTSPNPPPSSNQPEAPKTTTKIKERKKNLKD